MRWPFRRKADAASTEPTASPAAGGGAAGTASGPVARPVRQWAALPVIPVTISKRAPLVAGPPPVLPPLRPGRVSHPAPVVDVPLGTVTGLVHPRVRAVEPVVAVESAPLMPPPQAVRRAAVRATPAETPALVEATDEYVGEAREAADPYRAPSWLRFATGAPGLPMLPGLPEPEPAAQDVPITPPSFLPPELRTPPAPQVELPPRMQESVQPAAETEDRPARRRRPNLGQSRRLGLGAPIAKQDVEPLIHREEPPHVVEGVVEPPAPAREQPQEPPPPPAAPVHVAAEPPAPEPPVDRTPEPPEPPSPPAPPTPQPEPVVPRSETTPTPPRPEPADTPRRESVREPSVPGSPELKKAVATYRATAELRPAPRRREAPRATVVSPVPPDLAQAVRSRQQADVSTVPVYQGPKVDEAARARGARAFASGGAVFLPSDAGPVDSQKARGLLAHELVHAVQQRTLGTNLPALDSPLGQQLEAEAQAAERYYAGESGAPEPAPLIHAPHSAPSHQQEPDLMAAAQHADVLPAVAPAQTQAQPLVSPFDQPTRTEVGKIATESAKTVVAEWTNPKLAKQEGGGGTGAAAAAATGAAAATAAVAGANRETLVNQALERLNNNRAPGDPPITTLPPEEEAAIDRQLGLTTGSSEPPAQVYEKGSAKSWMHAITGQNMNYGLGLGGWSAKPGSEDSWFSDQKDERKAKDRVLDTIGITNAETENQFDYDNWFQPKAEEKKDDKTDAKATGTDQPAQREDYVFGRKNPDTSTVDMNKIDMDELASRLYDRVRSRLRLELLVDRERAGLLTDFR
jgi:hypothetical protein